MGALVPALKQKNLLLNLQDEFKQYKKKKKGKM
jgi:hypothetical protein